MTNTKENSVIDSHVYVEAFVKQYQEEYGIMGSSFLRYALTRAIEHGKEIGAEEERSRWTQPLLDDAISITVEARKLEKVLATRKFTSITEAQLSKCRTPFLLAEEAVKEILQALTTK